MIGYYTRDFRTSNVEAAVDYLALICLNADLPGTLGTSQAALCHEALRELVLETRQFARLLGDVDSRGRRIRGAIEERLQILSLPDQHAYLRTITVEAASVADDNGRITDAVLLYQLADDYDNVINVVNRALSEAIAVDIGQEEPSMQIMKPRTEPQSSGQQDSSLSLLSVDDPMILAKRIMQIYQSNTNQYMANIKDVNRQTCGTLVRLMEAKKKVVAREWAGALDVSLPFPLSLLPPSNQTLYRSSIPWVCFHSKPVARYHSSAAPLNPSMPSPTRFLATLAPSYFGLSPV